jgi:NurA domain
MSIDFQEVRSQVKKLGELAPQRAHAIQELREVALEALNNLANNVQVLRQKVRQIAQSYDPNLRCALPADPNLRPVESLNAGYPLPALPLAATLLAADGSQISPDRNLEVQYGLINVGAIQMMLNDGQAPRLFVKSRLLYDQDLQTLTGLMSDDDVALLRDLNERSILADLAEQAASPVITFTDGPMELWGAKNMDVASPFTHQLDEYLQVLARLARLNVATAGYVDKPFANLVVRLLEVALLQQDKLKEIKEYYPLRGVTDLYLFRRLLQPGERSAVFALQSKSAANYRDALALHFFYLNVGRGGLARVEIPAWVAGDPQLLDSLHAVLISQCQVMGSRPYPYLLHRAHETAVVTLEEKDQVTQMILIELRQRGVEVDQLSNKQGAKDVSGSRRSYTR